MNEPFISPWLIYAIEILDNMKVFLCIFPLIATMAFFGWGAFTQPDEEKTIAGAKRLAIICGGILLVAMLIPTKSTCAAMIIASKANPANYEAIKQELISLIGEVKKETE